MHGHINYGHSQVVKEKTAHKGPSNGVLLVSIPLIVYIPATNIANSSFRRHFRLIFLAVRSVLTCTFSRRSSSLYINAIFYLFSRSQPTTISCLHDPIVDETVRIYRQHGTIKFEFEIPNVTNDRTE
jgi:hypothetical protein